MLGTIKTEGKDMLKLVAIAWQALRLSKIVKSRTTKDAYAASGLLLMIACAVAAVVSQYTDVDTDTLITAITAAMAILSPLAARVAVMVHKEFDVEPSEMIIKVRRGNTIAWLSHSGSLRDAAMARWEQGVTVDGDIVDIQADGTGRKIGRKIRLPQPKKEADE
jgi:hypothetical protein